MATPMLPNTAIPSAPPSSAAVSEIPAAAPARSGGAEPMIRSFVNVKSGEVPSENSTDARAITQNPASPSIWVNIPNPTAAMASPPAINGAGRIRRTMIGVTFEPTTNASAQGSVHRPASSGEIQHQLQVLREEQEAAEHQQDA